MQKEILNPIGFVFDKKRETENSRFHAEFESIKRKEPHLHPNTFTLSLESLPSPSEPLFRLSQGIIRQSMVTTTFPVTRIGWDGGYID